MKKLIVLYTISLSISGFLIASAPEAKRRKLAHSKREAILNDDDRVALITALDENNPKDAITILNKYSRQALEKIIPHYQDLSDLINVSDNSTILHSACEHGTEDLVVILLDNFPVLITYVDTNGNTIIHTVCIRNRKDIAEFLCTSCPDLLVIQNADGDTCLHVACEYASKEFISILLLHTYQLVSYTNTFGQSPFDIACIRNKKAIVELLLATCPHIIEQRKKQLETIAFCQKSTSYNFNIIKLLVQYGTDFESEYKSSKIHYISKAFSCFTDTGLFIAQFKQLAPIINKLVNTKNFQDIRTFQKFQKTLLTLVYAHSQLHRLFNQMIQEYKQALPDVKEKALDQILHFLKALGKETNICSIKDMYGNTFLHKAIGLDESLDCKEIIKCLLGINVRILAEPNNEGKDCLIIILTTRQDHLEIINPILTRLIMVSGTTNQPAVIATQSL